MDLKAIVQSRFGKITRENAHIVFSEYSKGGRIKITHFETIVAFMNADKMVLDRDEFGHAVDQSQRITIFELTRLDFVALCCS